MGVPLFFGARARPYLDRAGALRFGQAVPQPHMEPSSTQRACWLCQNYDSEDVRDFHVFLSRHAHAVDAASAAIQFRAHLVAVRALRETVRAQVAPGADPGDSFLDDEYMDDDDADDADGAQLAPDPKKGDHGVDDHAAQDAGDDAQPDDDDDASNRAQSPHDGLPSIADIVRHVQRHNLDPSVRVAHILRNLVDLGETLREVVVSRSDDGQPLIDVRTVTIYLKVVSETLQIYKSADPTKMLFFGTADGGEPGARRAGAMMSSDSSSSSGPGH